MPDMLSQLGTFMQGQGGKELLATAGLGSNIASGVQNFQQQGRYNSAQSYLNNLIQNPAAFAAASAKYTQPLNQGLVTGVTNTTNANLAERGLGGSPAISQSVLAQALAPYILQNQQQGQQALLSSMGAVGGLKPSGTGGFQDLSKLLASLKMGNPGGAPGGGSLAIDPGSLPNAPDPLGLNTPVPGFGGVNMAPPVDPSSWMFDG